MFKKIGDDLRPVSWGKPRGGGQIVANRGPYSATRWKRKVLGLSAFDPLRTLDGSAKLR